MQERFLMIFPDRQTAGKMLLPLLEKYKKDPNVVVLGLPRGGVVLAYEIAKGLNVPLDVICLRKIGAPHSLELAIGAIDASGEGYFNERLISYLGVSPEYIQKMVEKEKQVAQKRQDLYRKNLPKLDLEGKTVLLVDDGLATGATMKAAVSAVQAAGAERIVVVVPVGPPDTIQELKELADEVIYLSSPSSFSAVGQFYDSFDQVEDDEVVKLLHGKS